MKYDISNKVIEDMVMVLMDGEKEEITISDKTDHLIRKRNEKIYPLILRESGLYEGIERKVVHYMQNTHKYEGIGIMNVEQFALLVHLRRQKLYGKQKTTALAIQDYLKNRAEYLKMGFYNISDFIDYKDFFDRSRDYNKAAYLYSTQKEYLERESYYNDKGVYSVDDYRLFSKMMEKSIHAYTMEALHKYISLPEYLDFELREFTWKKNFLTKRGSLKGVGAHIRKRYQSNAEGFVLEEHPYFLEPGYHFKKNGIRNFGELYAYYEEMVKYRHRHASEKIEKEYISYMMENIKGGKK